MYPLAPKRTFLHYVPNFRSLSQEVTFDGYHLARNPLTLDKASSNGCSERQNDDNIDELDW